MCAFSGLLFSFCSPLRQQSLSVDLSLLCASSSSSSRLFPIFSLLSPCAPTLSVLPSYSIHTSEEISLPWGNLKSGSCAVREREKKRNTLDFLFRIKRKGMGPFPRFVIIFCAGLSSMASVSAGAKLSFSILWGHMLIKQPADNSNYVSVASAPHWGNTVRERSASSWACTSKRLILFLIRAHPEWYNKCSLYAVLLAALLLCLPASLSSLY